MDPAAQSGNEFASLRQQILQTNLPSDLSEKLILQLDRLAKAALVSGYKIEFDKELEYLKFVASLPFNRSSQDILDLHRAAEILEKNHYGLKEVKERILEYLSVLILNSRRENPTKATVLAFIGLVGSGKTSLAYSIAEALGRKIIRIPLGGLGSVRELKGESRVKPEAEAGKIMQQIASVGVNNPVVLLDEIDRVEAEARADIMGVLVELLDPEQNGSFVDYYVNYPFDLSKVLFVATANNTVNIATAVMDRLEVIEMPAYSDEEKITIAKNYLLPRAIKESGVDLSSVQIEDMIWPQIVRPLGFDAGIRSLQRTVQKVVRKVAKGIVEGNPGPYRITAQNVGEYLNI